jgi:hypothetical protein
LHPRNALDDVAESLVMASTIDVIFWLLTPTVWTRAAMAASSTFFSRMYSSSFSEAARITA